MLAANKPIPNGLIPPQSAQALGLAILVELALLACVIIFFARTVPVRPKISAPVALTIINAITPPPPVIQPKPLPPQPKPKLTPKRAIAQRPTKPEPPAHTPPAPTIPLAPAPSPTAFTQPAPPPVAPPPPTPSVSSHTDMHAEYQDKVRAAVQAAVYYPPAAAAMHFSGRVRVEFHLRNSVPGEIHVVTSSDIGLIDRAALQAVQNARYPAPPDDLRDKDQAFQIWIALTLTNSG